MFSSPFISLLARALPVGAALVAFAPSAHAGADPFVGTWTAGDGLEARIAAPPARTLTLVLRGDVVQDGELEGTGATRQAAMNGCGATLTLQGAHLTIALDGPECPIELAATYARRDAPTSMKGPAIEAWRALLASGCNVKQRLYTPFEARVLRNAAFADVGYTFKSKPLSMFFAQEGYIPRGTPGLTDAKAKACADALKAREDGLQKTVPMSADLLDRLLYDPINFQTFRSWSDTDTSPFGRTSESKNGGELHWESRSPGCTADEACSAYTVDCATANACVAIAAG